MRLRTGSAGSQFAFLTRSSATSRTTDSEFLLWFGALFHGEYYLKPLNRSGQDRTLPHVTPTVSVAAKKGALCDLPLLNQLLSQSCWRHRQLDVQDRAEYIAALAFSQGVVHFVLEEGCTDRGALSQHGGIIRGALI